MKMLRQAPDANGCITVDWPSRNVPHGGVFHSRVSDPKGDSVEFLKVLLEESRFASELRKKSAWALRDDSVEAAAPRTAPHVGRPSVRPRTSRRRSLSCIRESGDLDVDTWYLTSELSCTAPGQHHCPEDARVVPSETVEKLDDITQAWRPLCRGEDREMLKQRLQEVMEWGDNARKQRRPATNALLQPPKAPKLPTSKDMRQELLTQIRERAEWLEEMEALGHAAPHRELIRDQIAERMRSLTALHIETERSYCDDGKGSARSSIKGTARSGKGVPGPERDTAPIAVNGSVCSGRSGSKGKRVMAPRSASVAPARRRGGDEDVNAYEKVCTPLAKSPRRRS